MEPQSTKRRVSIWTVGVLGNWIFITFFDKIVYPAVIWYFGLILGAAIMWTWSLVTCLLTLWLYDKLKEDWLGIETLKGLRESESNSRFKNAIAWFLQRSDLVVLVFLSVWQDPFITVAFMRQGQFQYNGLTRRDWIIFWISFVVCNTYWTLAMFMGVTVLEWMYHHVAKLFS